MPLIRVRLFILSTFLLVPNLGLPCSAFFVSGSHDAIVAKNLDWFTGNGFVMVNKRHVAKRAIAIDANNPLTWVSRYASFTFSGTGREFPWEGMNEAGLSVNALQLIPSRSPAPSPSLPAVEMLQWIQYILDTSGDLSEAMKNARQARVSNPTTLHYFVCDRHSECAVFEYIGGALLIHSGAELPYAALTNDPYSSSVDYFNRLSASESSGVILNDLDIRSLARFSRAALWSQSFVPGVEDAVSYAFRGLYNLSQIFPATGYAPGGGTFWSLAFDLRDQTVYWRTVVSPAIKRAKLSSFDLDCWDAPEALDLNAPGSGDVSGRFTELSERANDAWVDAWYASPLMSTTYPASFPQAAKAYPATTQCLEN